MQPSAQTTNILIGYNPSHNSRGTISLPCVSPNIAGDRREVCVLPNTGGDRGGEGRDTRVPTNYNWDCNVPIKQVC